MIVGVVLVAGVLTPVIADSIDTGSDSVGGVETDITGFDRYAKVDSSTNISIWPLSFSDIDSVGYSYTDPSEDPDAEKYVMSGSWGMLIGDGWVAEIGSSGSESNMSTYWTITIGDVYYSAHVIHISNGVTTIDGYLNDVTYVESQEISPVIYYPSPVGQYVYTYRYDIETDSDVYLPYYANAATEFVCSVSCYANMSTDNWDAYAIGTINSNSVFFVKAWNQTVINTHADSMTFTMTDGVLTNVSFAVNDTTYEDIIMPSSSHVSDNHMGGQVLLLPVSVYSEGSGSDSGISDSLATLLIVIPILVISGMVVMTISFFRRS